MKTNTVKFHVGLHVSEIGRSVDFYKKLLQSSPVKVKDDYAKFETDEVVLSLILRPDGVQSGFGHFGLRVENEQQLQLHHKAMASHGYQLVDEEKVDCCYAIQDKFWVKDPDGFDWEVYTFLEDTDKGIRPEMELAATATGENSDACCGPNCC